MCDVEFKDLKIEIIFGIQILFNFASQQISIFCFFRKEKNHLDNDPEEILIKGRLNTILKDLASSSYLRK